jgi:hypothetical protein
MKLEFINIKYVKYALLIIIYFIYSIINYKLGKKKLLNNNNNDNFTFIDSMYLTIITLTSVGYGDITPKTQGAKIIFILELIGFWSFIYFIF